MKIERVDLLVVRLPLRRPFETSSSRKDYLEHILVQAHAEGLVGWGEVACPLGPFYNEETTVTCSPTMAARRSAR